MINKPVFNDEDLNNLENTFPDDWEESPVDYEKAMALIARMEAGEEYIFGLESRTNSTSMKSLRDAWRKTAGKV